MPHTPTFFLPIPTLPAPRLRPSRPSLTSLASLNSPSPTCPSASASTPVPFSPPSRRRVLALTLFSLSLLPFPLPALALASPSPSPPPPPSPSPSPSPSPPPPAPLVTDRVYLDISIAGSPRGRLTLGLYGMVTPRAVSVFKSLATGSLRDRRGRTATYRYSQAPKVYTGHAVELGRVTQNDPLNQLPGTPARQVVPVSPPQVTDHNQLPHDRPGLVSVKKGGGFEFLLTAKGGSQWDDTWLVVGEVVDGFNLLESMVNVPVNRKTFRDGYRSVGRAIGDARANVDLEDKLGQIHRAARH